MEFGNSVHQKEGQLNSWALTGNWSALLFTNYVPEKRPTFLEIALINVVGMAVAWKVPARVSWASQEKIAVNEYVRAIVPVVESAWLPEFANVILDTLESIARQLVAMSSAVFMGECVTTEYASFGVRTTPGTAVKAATLSLPV